MADLIVDAPGPRPSRRGFFYYASAIVAGLALKRTALPADPDPADKAIAAFRAASAAIADIPDWEDLAATPAWKQRELALWDLARTRPTTRDGAHRMMSEIIMEELGGDGLQGDEPIMTAINSLMGALPHLA